MSTDVLELDTGVLLSKVIDSTLLVTLNRPDQSNALDVELMDALRHLWKSAASDPRLRCIVITGGGRHFCAGADASMLSAPRDKVGETASDELSFLPGPRVDIPVIAAVNGACAGGGLHFVADADISIAAEGARFLDPHVSIGQVTALEPLTLRLQMRPDRLSRMVLLGKHESIRAHDAELYGLVSEVVSAEDLIDRALELASLIALNSPEAVRLSRRSLRTFEERLLATDLDLGWELIRRHRQHPDALEGPSAFIEKREPRWMQP